MVLGSCGSRVHLMPLPPQPTAPFPLVTKARAKSQAALGHITLWPLSKDGLRRFPKIFLCWGQECKWKPLALILGFVTCPQRFLLAFIPRSIFIQCILISKYDLKDSILQNWVIFFFLNTTPFNWTRISRERYIPINHDRAAFSRPVVWTIINHMSFCTQRTKVNYRPAQWSMRYTQHLRYTVANFRVF